MIQPHGQVDPTHRVPDEAANRGVAPLDRRHHEECWASQPRQDAVYLLAWRVIRVVGRLTLLFRSRYPKVRSVLADVAEMNALEARRQGQGSAPR